MISATVEGFHQAGMACTLKHFPGYGDAVQDPLSGYATTDKTWEEMRTCELYPFQAGMASGADAVMVAHITTPNATEDGLPASLSYEMITQKLRGAPVPAGGDHRFPLRPGHHPAVRTGPCRSAGLPGGGGRPAPAPGLGGDLRGHPHRRPGGGHLPGTAGCQRAGILHLKEVYGLL